MKKRSATSTDGWNIDIDGVVRLAREYPDIVKGIKVQLSARESNAIGIKHIEAAKVASRKANIPVLMHIADTGGKELGITPPQMVGQAVSLMDPGDTVTHVLTPLTGSTLDQDGKILPEVLDAQRRGVFMDTAYGRNNFGWTEAELVMSQGLVPDSTGSDMQLQTTELNQLQSLLEYSSFFLHLGFSVDDVLRMITITPARFLRIEDRAGSLALGRDADIAVIDLVNGNWQFKDANNVSRVGSQALVPVLTVKSGRVIEPGAGLHPWGWAPPTVAALGVAV
jgi:dihydroorotase